MRISVDNNEYIQPPENRPTSPAYIIHHIITLALTMMLMACLVTYEIITPILAEIDMNRRI
jgi:quinol-cytochrome oxidoreductase complex cytochrome b subunit